MCKNDPFIRSVALRRELVSDFDSYPFSVSAIRGLTTLDLDAGATFLVGENGTGKSTLIEALAVAAGLNPEGGSQNFRFATRESHSALHEALRLVRGARRPSDSYFLRAESFFNVATQIEELNEAGHRPLLASYGDRSLHEQSHGESFLALALNRFRGGGFYILDEPEAALSVTGELALLRRMHELIQGDAQFIIATHSPILSGYPGARIYEVSDGGYERVDWTESEPYRLTKSFLDSPERFFRRLLD